jgi:cysteine desulfurase
MSTKLPCRRRVSRRNSGSVFALMRTSYLDWNANAPMRPEAIAAVAASLDWCGNPSSVHRFGRRARQAINAAREQVAALVGAKPEEIVFTSGGTEANVLALDGFPSRRRIVSAIEHDSVLAVAPEAARIRVAGDGVADLDSLDALLAAEAKPALISLMFANNETGAVQPVAAAARLAHEHGALLHCDAVQGPGKVPVDFPELGVDLMTISGHKIGGPMGIGALILRTELPLQPVVKGGGQERGRRGGTENLLGIIGFGTAAALAKSEIDCGQKIANLRALAEQRLLKLAPDAVIFAAAAPRLPNTIKVAMPGVAAATQVIALDLAGVAVSAGAACSSGKVTRSHVLDAMGVDPALAECAIRVSLGWSTSEAEIDHLIDAWGALYTRTRASAA